jgi:ribonuclease VapC
MIVDTSALLAILRSEPEARSCADAIEQSAARRISAGTLLEVSIVIDASSDPIASRRLDDLVEAANFVVEPVMKDQVQIGREAYKDFGKGSGHPAGLNFGDCFAYALSKVMREPLLFKGDDFIHTDIEPALRRSGE